MSVSATGETANPKYPNLRAPWAAGEAGGGASKGGAQAAKYKRAIAAAVTDDDVVEVILAMKSAAVGVEVISKDRKTGESRVYSKPPDTAAARLFFEVLRVIGAEASQVDLSTAPMEVLDWLEQNGKGG